MEPESFWPQIGGASLALSPPTLPVQQSVTAPTLLRARAAGSITGTAQDGKRISCLFNGLESPVGALPVARGIPGAVRGLFRVDTRSTVVMTPKQRNLHVSKSLSTRLAQVFHF